MHSSEEKVDGWEEHLYGCEGDLYRPRSRLHSCEGHLYKPRKQIFCARGGKNSCEGQLYKCGD